MFGKTESTFQKIIRKTGRKPISCKCYDCQKQCKASPCLGTPEDIEKLIDAGFGERVFLTQWDAGMMMGVTRESVLMYQAEYDNERKCCTFFTDEGLCSLHDAGLKPTEGKLSHHSTRHDTFHAPHSISWNVAKEWINKENIPIIRRIEEKLRTILTP